MGTPLRVLVVEDSEDDVLLLIRELQRGGYEPVFERVDTEEAMTSAIANQTWDIIISDYILPHFGGLEALRVLQKSCRDLPFIVVSGKISEEIAVEAMKAGAHDYMSKSNLKRFVPAVERELGEAEVRQERRQAEKALWESEERLRKAQEMAHLGNWVWDVKTGNVEWSEEVFRIFRLDPKEFTPQIDSIMALSPWPEDNARNKELIQKATKSHETGTYEQRFLRPDKSIGYYYSTFQGKYDGQGNLTTIVGTVQDITERKQMERELAQAKEEEFRAVFDNAVDGILIADMENKKFHLGNNSICRMLGYSPEEIKNLEVMDIHPEKDLPYVISQFERQVKGDFHLTEDLPVKRKDGSVFYADVNATTLKIAGKIYLMGFFHDTTERKNKEKLVLDANRRLEKVSEELSVAKGGLEQKNEALQKAGSELEQRVKERTAELAAANKVLAVTHQNMHTVIKHSADGLLIVDDNKIVRFMNQAAEVILGRKASDLLGEPFELPLTTDKPSEVQLVAADGPVTIVEVQAVRTEWENEPVHLATIRDITLLKKAQQETEAANEQLRKFNDLKDEFVSMVSHELRTPLSIISGAVKLLVDEIPGKIVSGQKEILDMATKNLNRLARIVDSLLNISKIESGKIELYRTDADICRLIAETVNEYSQQAEKKHINLSCQLPAHPVILFADSDRIKEVITNLLSNSLKFTPEGGSINVFCEERNDGVFIFVKDTGCGVAKNDIPRMFEKFTQFDRKVGPGEKGTGLGLAICKGLVNLHNGKIWAESDTDCGMKISFTIPRLSAEYIFTESVDNAVKSSLKTGGGAAVVLVSPKPVIQMDSPQMQAILKDVCGVLERNLRRNALNTVIQSTKEVLVVLGNCDITGAASVCQRLTQAIECHLADKDLGSKLDLLIGYAAYPDDGQTGQSLIEKAREAGVACLQSNKA